MNLTDSKLQKYSLHYIRITVDFQYGLDDGIDNPHFHVMCPIRPLNPDGSWGLKQRREYVLDEHGNRIEDENGNYIFNAVPTTNWSQPEILEEMRRAWAEMCNRRFEAKELDCRKLNEALQGDEPLSLAAMKKERTALIEKNKSDYASLKDERAEFLKLQKIVVHAPDKSSGKRRQRVQIFFNFLGEFNLPP